MDDVTGLAVSYVVGKAFDHLLSLLPNNTEKVNRKWREMMDDAWLEFQGDLRTVVARIEKLENQPSTVIGEREATALVVRLLPEAAAATTQERRRLLTSALAGLFRKSTYRREMRSRVSRAVMQLEPSDVVELREPDKAYRTPGVTPATMMTTERAPRRRRGASSTRAGRWAVGVCTPAKLASRYSRRWRTGHPRRRRFLTRHHAVSRYGAVALAPRPADFDCSACYRSATPEPLFGKYDVKPRPYCSAPGSLDTRLRYAATLLVKFSRALDGLTKPSFSISHSAL